MTHHGVNEHSFINCHFSFQYWLGYPQQFSFPLKYKEKFIFADFQTFAARIQNFRPRLAHYPPPPNYPVNNSTCNHNFGE